jgi:hypothetical protein
MNTSSTPFRVVPWLVVSLVIGYLLIWQGSLKDLIAAEQLSRSVSSSQGTVLRVTPGDGLKPPSVRYQFQLQNRTLQGTSWIKPDQVSSFSSGEPINVTYLPNDPSINGADVESMHAAAFSNLVIEGLISLILLIAGAFSGFGTGLTVLAKEVKAPRGRAVLAVVTSAFLSLMVSLSIYFFLLVPSWKEQELGGHRPKEKATPFMDANLDQGVVAADVKTPQILLVVWNAATVIVLIAAWPKLSKAFWPQP